MNKIKYLTKLKRKAFRLWSLKIRNIGKCELCGKKYGEINEKGKKIILQAHHIIGRENLNLAWDLNNGICLCSYCHKFSKIGPHKGSIIFSEWLRKNYPEKYEYLLKKWDEKINIDISFLENKINELKKEISEQKNKKEIKNAK